MRLTLFFSVRVSHGWISFDDKIASVILTNRLDVRIHFGAYFGVLIRIVPPNLEFSKFYPDYSELASKFLEKIIENLFLLLKKWIIICPIRTLPGR